MKKEDIEDKVKFILNNINNYEDIFNAAYSIKDNLIGLVIEDNKIEEIDFYKITKILTPQARSPLWEEYFIKKHNCKKINRDENSGDFEKNNTRYEYKASGFNQDDVLNIVQIRLFQDCDYIIQSISDKRVFTFLLKHSIMERESRLCKSSSAHGTETTNKENRNIELRFTIKKNSEDWERWCQKYLVNNDFPFDETQK